MSAKSDGTRFANVEGTENPGALVTFLDARASIEGEREIKELELAMLELNPGNRVLDVGCGTGDDAREIAPREQLLGSTRAQQWSPRRASERLQLNYRLNSSRATRSICHFPEGVSCSNLHEDRGK